MDPVAVEVRRCSQESTEGSTKLAFNSARNRLLSAKSLVFGQILIKIPLKCPTNEEDRNKPKEEICILMRQRHQNIVALYGLYERIWANCIQFCPVIENTLGPSLQNIIENEDPYTPADIYSWGYQTCRALEYLHDGLTVHLDVKPANLVVDATKKRLKLCDFDNALKLETGQPVGELYHSYTPYYVAPEILEECSFDNERVLKMDMYSFGVTLYVLFQKPNRQEIKDGYSIMKILSEDVPDKHINREKITDEKTAEFIERAWSSNSQDRPSTTQAREFMREKRNEARQ